MKMLTFLLGLFSFITFFSSRSAYAVDEASISILKKQGFEVRMGELTGAGSRMSLKRVGGFIHPQGIVMKKDCHAIIVAPGTNQADPKVSDVAKVQVDQSEILAREFEGFFYK